MITLEVACGTVASVRAAIAGGADRLELCSALPLGGLTPSDAFLRETLRISDVPVFMMVRPREGDFIYSDDEFSLMLEDIRRGITCGVHGFVFGILCKDGTVDEVRNQKLVETAAGLPCTFHRAFDLAAGTEETVEAIIRCGFKRLLTSGQQPNAEAGAPLIATLNHRFATKLEFMAGAGVRPDNVKALIESTGVREVHLSGKKMVRSSMSFIRKELSMGKSDSDEYVWNETDEAQVRAVRTILDSF